MSMRYTFRFDDVSVNTDAEKLWKMVKFLKEKFQSKEGVSQCDITFAVSLGVFDMSWEQGKKVERVFPSMLHTKSDFREFYKVQKIGYPECVAQCQVQGIIIASHGMVHVDHRLLSRKAQELSIVMSCALLKTSYFVAPFHKFNNKTEVVCSEHFIHLVKFGNLRHLLYHPFSADHTDYYLHPHDFTYDEFISRFS